MAEVIKVDGHGSTAVVTLNRPERLNAIDGALMHAALDAFEHLARDETVRAVVVTGAGRGFCAGGDLRALQAGSARREVTPERDTAARARGLLGIAEVVRTMPKPVIAAVNGACAGAGVAWACACDLRLAARSAFFSTAYLDAGLAGDYGISWLLTRVVGGGRAAELLLTGARLTADEAAAIGLVGRVVDDAQLLPAALEVARRFERCSPQAVADLKANLLDAQTLPLSDALDLETERLVRLVRSPRTADAAAATLDRSQR